MQKPEIRMPRAERELLKCHYEKADVILEYGCGGSTILASEMPGKRIIAVESDQAWCDRLISWFALSQPASMPTLLHVDIGPVGGFGKPVSSRQFEKFPNYSLAVWDRPIFEQPDVVLIDGRARAACFLATIFRTKKPLTILFDDYVDRPKYHCVEKYMEPTRIVGRMAVFQVEPTGINPEDLPLIASTFSSMAIEQKPIKTWLSQMGLSRFMF